MEIDNAQAEPTEVWSKGSGGLLTMSLQENSTKLWSADTVVSRFDIGHTTLHKWVKSGLLTPVRFSKRLVRYRASDIEALIDAAMKNGGVL